MLQWQHRDGTFGRYAALHATAPRLHCVALSAEDAAKVASNHPRSPSTPAARTPHDDKLSARMRDCNTWRGDFGIAVVTSASTAKLLTKHDNPGQSMQLREFSNFKFFSQSNLPNSSANFVNVLRRLRPLRQNPLRKKWGAIEKKNSKTEIMRRKRKQTK